MSRLSTRRSPSRTSPGERVFMDDQGRRWSAALDERDTPVGALVFRSLGDGRQPLRALAVSALALDDATDGRLREWLAAAPPVGILS